MSDTLADREGFAAFVLRMRSRNVGGKPLFTAIETLPRAAFVDGPWQSAIWSGQMIPIDCGEVLEGIDFQAEVIAALEIGPGQRILEIGTGSGYTAAIMARLGARVVTLDRYRRLVDQANRRFAMLGVQNVAARHADVSKGVQGDGPFDRIVSWAAFDSMPRAFVEQLTAGGIMIAPIGPGDGEQALAKLGKVGSRFEREDIGRVRLQPIVQGLARVL